MKTALRALLIAPEPSEITEILLGKRCISIREGHRDYVEGPILIGCHIANWAVMADVTKVRHTLLQELSFDEIFDAGLEDHTEMYRQLQQFYPYIAYHSPVTVIRWENVRGTLTGETQ